MVVFDLHDSKDNKNKGKYKDLEHVLNPDMAITPLWKEFLDGVVPWYGIPVYQAILDKIYEEISFTCTEINSSYEANYADSTLNFFGVSSGIRYQNLDSNTFESH